MFVHDDSIVFPRLIQRNLPTGRIYEVTDGRYQGEKFPSITRILGAKPKPFLEQWKKKVGYAEANRIVRASQGKGTSLHSLAEEYIGNNELPEYQPNVAELWVHLRPWLDQHVTRVFGQEVDVFSVKLKAAGRFDLLAEIDGKDLAIIDFKNSRKPKREEWVGDYFLQGTFYSCAVYELTGRKAKRIILPVVSPEGLQLFETTPLDHLTELTKRINEYYACYA